jgi:hypothetical protein
MCLSLMVSKFFNIFCGHYIFFDEWPLEVQPTMEDKNLSIYLRWNNILLIYIMWQSIICITLIRRLSHFSTYVIFLNLCSNYIYVQCIHQLWAVGAGTCYYWLAGLLQGTLGSGGAAAPARLVLAGLCSFFSNDICLWAAANLCFYILQIWGYIFNFT